MTLLVLITIVGFSSIAFAQSSQYGSVDGKPTSGSLGMYSSSASAATTISGVIAGLYAYVEYTYGWGTVGTEFTVSANRSNAAYSVTATAYAGHYNPVSLRARGSHSVSYNGQFWSASTSIN